MTAIPIEVTAPPPEQRRKRGRPRKIPIIANTTVEPPSSDDPPAIQPTHANEYPCSMEVRSRISWHARFSARNRNSFPQSIQ